MAFRFQVITLFPEMIQSAMAAGVFGQAQKKNLVQLSTLNPRDFTTDVHRTVDERPFGGGDGMIMLAEPLQASIQAAKSELPEARVVYLSPQGQPLTHQKAKALASENSLIFVCGRYGGIDQRVINHFIDEEISIGDYVISGGELAACIVMDAVSRFVPGVLGHQDSADKDSFSNDLLEHPNFTRPREYLGQSVPEVLLGGNHKVIHEWKTSVGVLATLVKRPDLLLGKENRATLEKAEKLWHSWSDEERAVLGLQHLQENDFAKVSDSIAHGTSQKGQRGRT